MAVETNKAESNKKSTEIQNDKFTQELVELVQALQIDAKALEALHNLTKIIRKNTSSNAVRIY